MIIDLIKRFCKFVSDNLNPFEEEYEEDRYDRYIDDTAYNTLKHVLPTLEEYQLRSIGERLGIYISYLDNKEDIVERILNYIKNG